jgi:hypothetical protein
VPLNSRAKGKRGEGEVAKILEGWWQSLEAAARFKSTPASGGWAQPDTRGPFRVAGDLATTAELWPFCAEVKYRQNWTFGRFSMGKPSPVWGWWRQCVRQAREQRAEPMLWLRRNRQPWLVLLSDTYARPILGLELDLAWPGGLSNPAIDFAEVLPCGILGRKLITMDPRLFALPGRARGGSGRRRKTAGG